MILHVFYVKDQDGDKYIGVPTKKGLVPCKKDSEWNSPPDGFMQWFKVSNEGISHNYILQELIDISQLPEPSWEDESPMEVLINLSVSNVTYMYED